MADNERKNSLLYFSYGSNMSTARLKNRISSPHFVAVARLHEHRLKFHKKSKDNSGKCDAECTGEAGDIVYGAVFRVSALEKEALDEAEGLGHGYEEKAVTAIIENGDAMEAVMYYATDIDRSLKPYRWYKEHVIRGAREHGLPPDYITTIEATEAVPDPDAKRRDRELSVYR